MATECGDGDYLGAYRRFFEDFVAQVDPDDQLPVKVSTYDLTEGEISGEIIDWTLQYLNQKYCPPSLQSYLVRLVMEEVKPLCSKQPEACGYRFQENSFAPLKLMHTVTRKVNEICLRYLDNSRLALLPPPPSTPIPLVSRCAIKNSRRKMEDRYVVIHDLHTIFSIQDDSVGHYYAVFDGHAGQDAAVYCAAHLHQYLAESIHYPTDPERALRDAFLTTDAHFIEKSNKQNLNSGTTAVCALLLNKKLYIAWVGDSQAVLAKRGQITQLVNPHKPDRDDERERVNDMGGAVIHWGIWRVNGQLAVSRAIGDVQYKPYVTGDPDIRCIPLDGMEDFLIVACDGLWDYVSEAMATTLVYQQLREDPCDLEAVSQRLVFFARSQGSTDNISAIVVFLTNPRQIATRHPSSHPLLADVQLNNMESTNPFLSNANGLQQFDANPFGKQQHQHQQQSTNGTCADNDENIRYRDDFEHSTNGKHPNGSGFDNNGDNHGHNNDDDDDDDEDDDLGPETDVDAVDEGSVESAVVQKSSPIENLSRELFPEKIHDEHENENFQITDDTNDSKGQIAAVSPRPAETADQHALIPEADNVADSEDSEDEWNYYPNKDKERIEQSGETAGEIKENDRKVIPDSTKCGNEEIFDLIENNQLTNAPVGADDSNINKEIEQPELIDAEICAKQKLLEEELSAAELEDMDFQLNPNAAEFVPVSPPKLLSTRTNLNDDFLLSGSPQKQTPEMDDIQVPSQGEFQVEVSLRPHETENSNGKATEELPQTEFTDYLMDRQKSGNGIAASGLDESEVSSTKAEFGDESSTSFMAATEFQRTGISIVDDSFTGSDRADYDISKDPMAMSFTPGDFQAAFGKEGDDLNAIHQLNDSDLIGDEDTPLANDESFAAQSPDLHPELTTLVTPDTDHPPPTSAFPDGRGEFANEFVENFEKQSSPTSPEPLIENETSLMSGMVELIPSSCLLGSHTGNDSKISDQETDTTGYRALDTSSPLHSDATSDKAFALSPEPVLHTFCGVSDKADIRNNISPIPPVALESETPVSPAPTAENVALEVASLLAEELSPSPQNPSPSPGAEIVESEKITVEKDSAGPDLFSFENSGPLESNLSTQITTEDQLLDKNEFESHKEVYSPILDAELNVSQAMIDSVLDTPPVSHNRISFNDEVNTSPDEQFNLVLDQTELNESPAAIEKEKDNIFDEFNREKNDEALVTLHQDKPPEECLTQSKNVFDVACPPFSTGNFSRKDLGATDISPLSPQLYSGESQLLETKENVVETQVDSELLEETVLPKEAAIPPETEIKTLENLINEEPPISTPVMNLSESMQEFTGLEEQLKPEPPAPLLNGLASDIGIKPEFQRPSQGIEVVENLVEQKIASVETEVKSEVTEKKEETERKTEDSSVVAPLAAATAVAAIAATAAAAASATANTTKTKTGLKATPRTTTATNKTTNKSTPTSPTKAASATQRATGTTVPKKPAAATTSRPKQLETTKTTASTLTSKSPVAKSTATTKPTTLNKTKVSRTSTVTASKPKPTSATSKPATPPSSTDKKPTTNGDAKPLSRPAAPKPAARPSTGTTIAASKTLTKPSTTTRTASSTATTAPLRSRPASAATTTSTTKPKVAAATGTTSTTATSRPKSSPAPAARDTKVRSTFTKSPATDKQTKETTNKQLSSARTSASKLTKSSSGRPSTGTTTLAKRSLAGKNLPPAATPQPQKKPAPITRPGGKLSSLKNTTKTTITSSTTKTTEVQVVQNGVSEVHEKKTVITSNNVEEDVPQKDVSPVTLSTDNQLIMTAD